MSGIFKRLKINKKLDTRALLVFQRLRRFYKTLNIISALVGGLSLAVLSFTEFHPTQLKLAHVSEGFLCSSAMTAVISVMLSTMLLFTFEGHETATRKDLFIAWSPLFLMDCSIMEYLFGLVFWFCAKNGGWRAGVIITEIAILFFYSLWVAIWMWQTMRVKGGLGKEEIKASAEMVRVADK